MDNEQLTLGLDKGHKPPFRPQKWAVMFMRIIDKCGLLSVKEMLLVMSYVMADLNMHDNMIKHLETCIKEIKKDKTIKKKTSP